MTLELSPELEKQVEAAARQRGTDAHAFGIEAIRRALDPDAALDALLDTLTDSRAPQGLAPLSDEQVSREAFYEEEKALNTDTAQKRREAALAGFGMFAGHGLSVDELLDERSAEAQREAGNLEATA